MWCSSSTFTSAGSTGSIPTGSTSTAPVEWTRCRTAQRQSPLPPAQLPASQTNQKGRRRMIKREPAFISDHPLPTPHPTHTPDLTTEGTRTCENKLGRKFRWTPIQKRKKNKQFNCSLSVHLVNSYFCPPPSFFAVQVE